MVSTATAVEPSDDSQSDDTDSPVTDKQMTKGVLRRLRRTMEALHTLLTLPAPVRRKVLEICTWTGNLSAEAHKRGWQVISPVTLETGYDLTTKTGRRMGHMPMTGTGSTLEAFADIPVKRRIFVHINNTNPALLADSRERAMLAAAGWEVAEDGMEFCL
jgi:hypothetical protein